MDILQQKTCKQECIAHHRTDPCLMFNRQTLGPTKDSQASQQCIRENREALHSQLDAKPGARALQIPTLWWQE